MFEHNEAEGEGGAIEASNGDTEITNSTLSSNSASNGGAVASGDGSLELDHVTMKSNTALANGGAIKNIEGPLTLTDSQLTDGNRAGGASGAIEDYIGAVIVSGSKIEGDSAEDRGGIADLPVSPGNNLVLEHSTVSKNSANSRGGGMFLAGPLADSFSAITDNKAAEGGGIFGEGATDKLTSAVFAGNTPNNCEPATLC